MYGFSKQLFDLWVKNQGVQNKLVGLKYFNVFGPRQDPSSPYSGVISKFCRAFIKNEKIVN